MRLPYRNKKATLWVLFGIIAVTMFLFKYREMRPICFFKDEMSAAVSSSSAWQMRGDTKYVKDDNQQIYAYNREMPLIFIGGVPRSGTTLMRAMLDAHPDVRCGQETRVIPRILQLRSHWLKSEKESLRLVEAGITKEVMNSAIAQFCLEIIAKHGEPAPRLCNKDPLTLKMGSYVIELFPNAKFLFMVRDGRATVHSIISRKVTITGFDLTSYRQCMQKWNHAIEVMHDQCKDIGKKRCMMVYYEQLVLHPEEWMRRILDFVNVPWNDAVLHHEEFINKPNGVPLSKVERSSDQVIKPVNLEALSKWVGHIPKDVIRDMADIAPMLSVLGYDPFANPPDYGKPDAWVQDNTSKVRANQKMWEYKVKEVLNMPLGGSSTGPKAIKSEETNGDDNIINDTYAPSKTKSNNNNDNSNHINNGDDTERLNEDTHDKLLKQQEANEVVEEEEGNGEAAEKTLPQDINTHEEQYNKHIYDKQRRPEKSIDSDIAKRQQHSKQQQQQRHHAVYKRTGNT